MQQTAHTSLPHTAGFAHPSRNVLHFQLEPGMSAADFGAGSGYYVWPMAEALGEHGRLFAIDVQQDLLRRIHNEARGRGLRNVRILWADLEAERASKLADHTLDLVLVSNVLFQLERKFAAIAEARRILKHGGRLAVIDWVDSFGGMGPERHDVVTKDQGLSLVRQGGFELVREFPAGAHHWGFLARPA